MIKNQQSIIMKERREGASKENDAVVIISGSFIEEKTSFSDVLSFYSHAVQFLVQ